jgi:hypothetical protein
MTFTQKALVSCRLKVALALAMASLTLSVQVRASAALQWAGRSWNITSGEMAGVCAGDPANVSVDANGYLHLKITKNGNTWSAAELFTSDKLGFGTYQWQTEGPIDRFDPNVVLGFYPYGPAGGVGQDGSNEIDIEYSRWGQANGANGDWTGYPSSGTTIGELSYTFSLNGGMLSTSRFIWSTSQIESFLINGIQPVGSVTDLIKSWTYAPTNSKTNIPQQAMPLGMNLWCFEKTPTDSLPVEVVIRDFEFIPEGTASGGASGASGVGGGGAAAGGTGSAGATSVGGASVGGARAGGSPGGTNATGSAGVSALGGAEASIAGNPSSATGDPRSNVDQSSSCSLSEPGNGGNGLAFLGLLAALPFASRVRRRPARADAHS